MLCLALFAALLAGWAYFTHRARPWIALPMGLGAMLCAVAITHLVWRLRFDYADLATRDSYRRLLETLMTGHEERAASALRQVLATPPKQDGQRAARMLLDALAGTPPAE